VVLSESQCVLEEHNGSKFRKVVFDIKAVLTALNNGVTPRHRNVVDAHFAFVATAQFELGFLLGDREQMDVTRGILV